MYGWRYRYIVLFTAIIFAVEGRGAERPLPEIESLERLGFVFSIEDGRPHAVVVPSVTSAGKVIVDSDLGPLSALTSLRAIDLSGCSVTDAGLGHLRTLTSLEHLDLSNTRVTGCGFEHLRGLSRLRSVSLSGTQCDDNGLTVVCGLASICDIDLSATLATATGVAQLSRLPNLTRLSLRKTYCMPDAMVSLGRMRTLTELNLASCGVRSSLCEQLVGLPLISLDLRSNGIDDKAIAHLSKVETLEELLLNSTGCSFRSVEELQTLARLRVLEIDAHDPRMRKTLLGLRSHINGLRIAPSVLRGCRATTSVDATGNAHSLMLADIRGLPDIVALRELGELRHLKHLSIIDHRASDKDVVTISQLAPLQSIDVRATSISRTGLMALIELDGLHELHVNARSVSDADMAIIRRATQSVQIHRE